MFAAVRFSTPAEAQVRPVYDRGVVGLTQLLNRLNQNGRALMIGAHPDDEDTALLTYLARGEYVRTGYLSLTRGDGGQNIIGTELGEALGVIRTEELLQARTLDGAEQFFTRAYDFGFSKTLAEAKGKWDEKIILCDAVRVIRAFRPQIVISQFTGTPADGHGQHQYSGYISPLAVSAANDANRCSGSGAPWQVRKFYVRHRGSGDPTLRINTGKYDPLLGRSYFEIAMEARSQHKSQEQGVLELRGSQFSALKLQGSESKESSIVEGLEQEDSNPDLSRALLAARDAFNANDREKLLTELVRAHGLGAEPAQRKQIEEAIALALGLQIDALADTETVVPGEAFAVGVKLFAAPEKAFTVKGMKLIAPAHWTVAPDEVPKTNTLAFNLREATPHTAYFKVTPPVDAEPTQPYWLREPRDGDLFHWPAQTPNPTLPFQERELKAQVILSIFGKDVSLERKIEFRFADDIRGELRRDADVVPRTTLRMDQSLIVVPTSAKPQSTKVAMTVTNHSRMPTAGSATLTADGGAPLKISTGNRTFELKRQGESSTITFDVTIPANLPAGQYRLTGSALVGGSVTSSSMRTLSYPHIQTRRYYRPASVDIQVIDLRRASVKVGYVEGSGDSVFEAIRQIGFDTEAISEAELASGDLSRFDTIVVGIRAYQVRPDVVANNERLLDFARRGGTLVVQYQLPAYAQQKLMPFPSEMGPRTADENAPVSILDPAHALMSGPNKITDADFAGWVQERNLYNFSKLGNEYTGLLETHDLGEPENNGGLVVAKLGEGAYIYCSYSLFRQLPAGVSGAYRLLANMVSYSSKTRNRLKKATQ